MFCILIPLLFLSLSFTCFYPLPFCHVIPFSLPSFVHPILNSLRLNSCFSISHLYIPPLLRIYFPSSFFSVSLSLLIILCHSVVLHISHITSHCLKQIFEFISFLSWNYLYRVTLKIMTHIHSAVTNTIPITQDVFHWNNKWIKPIIRVHCIAFWSNFTNWHKHSITQNVSHWNYSITCHIENVVKPKNLTANYYLGQYTERLPIYQYWELFISFVLSFKIAYQNVFC